MAKVTDFRVGNYITDAFGKYFYRVQDIDKWRIMAQNQDAGLLRATSPIPIELTPEILEALEFEDWGKTKGEFPFRRWVLHNVIGGTSNFEVHQYDEISDGIKEYSYTYSIDIDENMNLPNSQYLHTLQNAFHLFAGYDFELDFTKIKTK